MAKCCHPKFFKNQDKYFFNSDMVSQGCVAFKGDHEEELEKIFMERNQDYPVEEFIEWVCSDDVTKACIKVEPESLKKPVFYLDGVA